MIESSETKGEFMNGHKEGWYLRYQIEPDSDKTVTVQLDVDEMHNEEYAKNAAETEYKRLRGTKTNSQWMGYPELLHVVPLINH